VNLGQNFHIHFLKIILLGYTVYIYRISCAAFLERAKDTVVHRSFSVGLGGGRFRAGQAANMLHMSMKASWEAVDSTNVNIW
jgi:hypothetical protein